MAAWLDMPQIPFPRTGAPALRALEGAGYSHLQELDGIPMRSVLALPGMDPKERRDPLTPFAR